MGLKHFSINCIDLKAITKSSKIAFRRLLYIGYTIILSKFLVQCEGKERYYRPNLPEKLCSIGIIDADDTSRHISFEKSFQSEYPEETNDSLRGLTFEIASVNRKLISCTVDHAIKTLYSYKMSDSIEFHSGERYFLTAQEEKVKSVSSGIVVPNIPSIPSLNALTRVTVVSSSTMLCKQLFTNKSAVVNISFKANSEQKLYYAILVEGSGGSLSSIFIPSSGFLDFSVRESNSPGFFAEFYGYSMYHFFCKDTFQYIEKSPVSAYFIEGIKIPDSICNITLSVQFSDFHCVYDILQSLHIRLLSIPEELYEFEKNIYAYEQNRKDPFSEPVYLNGNIKGGNGIFAICRSTELSIKFSPWY
jgi:hypothetical protein